MSTYRVSFPGLRLPPPSLPVRAAYKQDPVDLRTRKREDAPQSPSSSLPCAFAFLEEHNLVAVGLTTGEVLSILLVATQSLPDLSRRCTSIGTNSSLMCSGKLRQSLLLQARECTRRWDGKAPILGPILSNTWGSRSKGAQRGPSCVPVPLPGRRAGCLLPS